MPTISKLQPHQSMYIRGFDRRGAAASLHNASATGCIVSGCWSDQADFAVLVLHDMDDTFGHLHTSRYLPSSSLAGVVLDFDLALTGCMSPTSYKYQSVPWGALSWIKDEKSIDGAVNTAGNVVTWVSGLDFTGAAALFTILIGGVAYTVTSVISNDTIEVSPSAGSQSNVSYVMLAGSTPLASLITSATGMAPASRQYTLNGAPVAYDRVELIFLSNLVFDFTYVPGSGSSDITFNYSNSPGTGYVHDVTICPTVSLVYSASFGVGYWHSVTIGSSTYNYIQQLGDDAAAVTHGLSVAMLSDLAASGTGSGSTLTLSAKTASAATISASDGNMPTTLLGKNTYHYTQASGDSSTVVAAGIVAAVNFGSGDPNAVASNVGAALTLTAERNDNSIVSCSTSEATGQSGSISRSGNTVTFGFFNYLGTGYDHYITVGSNSYHHAQLPTDGSGDIAIALAGAINSGSGDPNAFATVSANNVILSPIIDQSTSCAASDGNGPGTLTRSTTAYMFAFSSSFGTGYTHFVVIGANTYSYVQQSGDDSTAVAAGMAAAASGDTLATATPLGSGVTLLPKTNATTIVSASDGPGQSASLLELTISTTYAIDQLLDVINESNNSSPWCDKVLTTSLIACKDSSTKFTVYAASAGRANVSGDSVTWVSGQNFVGCRNGDPICINGVAGAILTVNSATSITLTASADSGTAVPYTAPNGGLDGNSIELHELHKTATMYLTPADGSKLVGGVGETSFHATLDFSALGLTHVRQAWLTFAPILNYDSGANDHALIAYTPSTFEATFSNWTVTDSGGVTPLKLAGPGSVAVASSDSWTTRAGSGWGQVSGWYVGGYAWQSSHAGDTVTVKYNCQSTHDLYLGTAVSTTGGIFSASVDGGAPILVNAYALQSSASPISGRRLIKGSVVSGVHSVVLTVASGTCLFDFLQAAVPSDPVTPLTIYSGVNCACDFDTGQTYQVAPARLLWILSQAGFQGDVDFYTGVFFALKRTRSGGNFHQATVSIAGTTFNYGTLVGDGDAFFIQVGGSIYGTGGTTFNVAVYPADTLTSLAQRFVNAINASFVGICAAPTGIAGQFTVTQLSPINGFSLFVYAAISGVSNGAISYTGDVLTGNEGTWQVDSSQSSPLNKAFVDYVADLAVLLEAAGQTMTVAFSQELLGAPDVNTAAGAWTQRFANGDQVLTATGFGLWGAGVVESVSGSGPQTVKQTGHGYITGNLAHVASSTQSGTWRITVVDVDHYALTTLISGGYTVGMGDSTYIELQTTQCNFNPSTVTAYLEKCYLQAAGILSAAGLVPWLQLGEVGWWFYSRLMNEAVGYASWTSPISVGTSAPHGFNSGEKAIVAAVLGATAANGTWPIVVVDPTHFTETGSSGNAAYASGGTVSGGGMAYYDAYTASAAATALGRALASFWTQDDDPSINSHADANFLRGLLYTHVHAIVQAVKAAYAGAKFEWLLPMDVNNPTVYWNAGYPYPQGGRLNCYVNIPSQYTSSNGDIDRVKTEALSWGTSYLNIDLAKAAIAYAFSTLAYAKSATAYLIPWSSGACAWTSQYLAAVNAGVPLIGFWAVDHLCLLSWPLPLPINKARAQFFG